MKLYLGSRHFKPAGFQTVDIDPGHKPDILADVTDLHVLPNDSIDEICASHILEHIAWPLSFKALSEWARVLKSGGVLRIAVPDLRAIATMIAEGKNVWHAMGLVYGVLRIENVWEAHQYGWTSRMLVNVLRALGFSQFDWWDHDQADASAGWAFEEDDGKVGISLNIQAIKTGPPMVSPLKLLGRLMENRLRSFDQILAEEMSKEGQTPPASEDIDPLLLQRLHFSLLDARQRIKHLEGEKRGFFR